MPIERFAAVVKMDLEGVAEKPAASTYRVDGSRSPWFKIKHRGYTRAEGRHERFERVARRRSR